MEVRGRAGPALLVGELDFAVSGARPLRRGPPSGPAAVVMPGHVGARASGAWVGECGAPPARVCPDVLPHHIPRVTFSQNPRPGCKRKPAVTLSQGHSY